MGGGVADVASIAAPGIGGGIGAWAAFRFVRWAFEFTFRRIDLRASRMDERERALEKRYDLRLAHVETELKQTRQALMLLLNDVARNNPANPVLQRVAELLGTNDARLDSPFTNRATPAPDEACDQLLSKLQGVPGVKRP